MKHVVVDQEMITMAKNTVAVRLEFEARAKTYYEECKRMRQAAERKLKKLEAQYK